MKFWCVTHGKEIEWTIWPYLQIVEENNTQQDVCHWRFCLILHYGYTLYIETGASTGEGPGTSPWDKKYRLFRVSSVKLRDFLPRSTCSEVFCCVGRPGKPAAYLVKSLCKVDFWHTAVHYLWKFLFAPLPEKSLGGLLDIDAYSLKDVTIANVTAFAHLKKLKKEQSFFVYYRFFIRTVNFKFTIDRL